MSAPVPFEIQCREMVELVTTYLEGTLSVEDRTLFEMHICSCEGCHVYLDQMRQIRAATGRLSEESLPAGAREELLRVFRDWKQRRGGTT